MKMFDVEGGVCKMVGAMENEVYVVCMRGGCCIEVDSRSREEAKKTKEGGFFFKTDRVLLLIPYEKKCPE